MSSFRHALAAAIARRIPFVRSAQTAAHELSMCVDFDRAIDPATGRQRFDMTPPPDLPPPPSNLRDKIR